MEAPGGDSYFAQENPAGKYGWLYTEKTDLQVQSELSRTPTGNYQKNKTKEYFSGVRMHDIMLDQEADKVAVIECQNLKIAKSIFDQKKIECNFLYVKPPSTDDILLRIIRNRHGSETQDTLKQKMAKINRELSSISSEKWINEIIMNDTVE